jgi:hypothetical protein
MSKTTGIIYLRFKEGISEDKVQEIINNTYLRNKAQIEAMEYSEFDKEETLIEVNRLVKDFCKAN